MINKWSTIGMINKLELRVEILMLNEICEKRIDS